MSPLSFKLSKKGKVWHATGTLPGAKSPFDIDCGDGSEQSARKMAGILLHRRAQLVEASKSRWRKFHAEREKAKAAATPATPEPDDDDDDEPEDLEEQEAAAAEHVPPDEPPPATRDHEKIKAKLLALGDAVDPDEVIPPGGDRGDVDEDPVDDETGKLVSNVIAGVFVNWHTRKITKVLKNRKPPRRPGEADDQMLAWEHDGIAYNLEKLVGKAVALGPTGKMLVGFTAVTAMMMLDSEPIEGARAPEAPPAADEPRGNANGTPTDQAAGETEARPPAQLSLVKHQPPPLGKF